MTHCANSKFDSERNLENLEAVEQKISVSVKLHALQKKLLLPFFSNIVDRICGRLSRKLENSSDSYSEETEKSCCACSSNRHVVLLIGTLCIMMILSNILIPHVTLVFMTGQNVLDSFNDSATDMNSSVLLITQPEFDWSSTTMSNCYTSMSTGALLSVPLAVYLIRRIGAHKAFILAGIVTVISTAINPATASWGLGYFYVSRAAQGAPLAFSLPIIGAMSASWSTSKHTGFFLSFATSFAQLAPAFTYPLSGLVSASSWGWPAANYIHAAVTVLLFTLWAIFYKDTPHTHPLISKRELSKISIGKSPPPPGKLPVSAIFTSKAIWAVWVAIFAHFVAIQLYVIYLPAYLFEILGMPIEDASIFSAIPPLVQIPVKLIAAIIADRQKCVSQTTMIRVFNTIASLGCGFVLLILGLIPTSETLLQMILLCVSSALLGFNIAGVFRSTALVARHHTYFVTGVIQFIYLVILLTMPYVVSALKTDQPTPNWTNSFIIMACLLSFTNVFFCLFGKGTAAEWTKVMQVN